MLRNQMRLNKVHRIRKILALLALATACLVITGCGGGDDESDSGSTVLVKADFIEQGNEICSNSIKKKEAGLQKMFAQLRKEEVTEKEQEELIEKLALPPIYEMVEELAALGLPEGEEAKAEKMVKGFEKAASKFEEDTNLALTQYATYMNKPSRLAKELDLKTCARI